MCDWLGPTKCFLLGNGEILGNYFYGIIAVALSSDGKERQTVCTFESYKTYNRLGVTSYVIVNLAGGIVIGDRIVIHT